MCDHKVVPGYFIKKKKKSKVSKMSIVCYHLSKNVRSILKTKDKLKALYMNRRRILISLNISCFGDLTLGPGICFKQL